MERHKRPDEHSRSRKSKEGRQVWLPASPEQYAALKAAAKARYQSVGGFLLTLAKKFMGGAAA